MRLKVIFVNLLLGAFVLVVTSREILKNETEIAGVEDTTVSEAISELESTEDEENESKGVSDLHSASYGFLNLPKDYNKLAIPTRTTSDFDSQVYVKVSIFLRNVLDIDQTKEELTFDADVTIQWVDWKIFEHLEANNFSHPVTKQKLSNITLDARALKAIWQPDIFIDEMAGTDAKFLLGKLVTLDFLAETNNENSGDIVYSARTTLKLRCEMKFDYFPADTQTCEYHIRSYSYKDDSLTLNWNTYESKLDGISTYGVYLNEVEDPNFDLQVLSVAPVNGTKRWFVSEKFDKYRVGNYSTLRFTIQARRKLSYHVLQTYVPSVLLILITWVCFIIPSSMIEARIGISMTTVLTLTAMFSSVRERSPDVSYVMAVDIWMCFCIFFVFIALLIFTLIYWMKLRLQKRVPVGRRSKNGRRKKGVLSELESQEYVSKDTYRRFVIFTKRYAFWVFALVFLCFLWAYWTWLLLSSNYFKWNPSLCLNKIGSSMTNEHTCPEGSEMYTHHSEDAIED